MQLLGSGSTSSSNVLGNASLDLQKRVNGSWQTVKALGGQQFSCSGSNCSSLTQKNFWIRGMPSAKANNPAYDWTWYRINGQGFHEQIPLLYEIPHRFILRLSVSSGTGTASYTAKRLKNLASKL